MSQDPDYYAMRALEERRLANLSADPRARRVHLEMAAKYPVLAGPNAVSTGELRDEDARRTA